VTIRSKPPNDGEPRTALNPQTIAIHRQNYPDALVCVGCGVLLATRPESYAKSNLTETDRLSYVCFECRLDLAEAERIHEGRVEKARHAAQASAEARCQRAVEAWDVVDVDRNPTPVYTRAPGARALTPRCSCGFWGWVYIYTQAVHTLSTPGWPSSEAPEERAGSVDWDSYEAAPVEAAQREEAKECMRLVGAYYLDHLPQPLVSPLADPGVALIWRRKGYGEIDALFSRVV
jgi:hypothetical protein